MIDLFVEEVMTQSVQTITPDTTACEVATLFVEADVSSAVVVSPDSRGLIGIVTESDLIRQVAAGEDIASVHVESFLSTPLVTIDSTEEIHDAATLMKEHSIRQLPVTDDGNLVGILTTTDLAHYLPRLREKIRRE